MGHGLTPEQADRLLEQGAGPEDPGSRALAAFVSDLRAQFESAPDEAIRGAHLAAMAAVRPEAVARPVPRAKPRRLFRGLIAAFGLGFLSASAMAATGTLPDPVQDGFADSVALVGVNIPGGSDEVESKGTPNNPRAAANKARARAFTDAKKEWLECVKEAERAAKEDPGSDPVDREAVCGEKPHPHDYGIPAKNENANKVKPANENKPEKTAKPERTEKPDRPASQDGPSPDAGPPDHANAPDDAGPPDDVGPLDDVGSSNRGGPTND